MKNTNNLYLLKIKLIDSNGKAITAHKIEAWDYDGKKKDDYLGLGKTNSKGQCNIKFSADKFNKSGDTRPDIYFKVFKGKKEIYNSKNDVIYWGLNAPVLDIILRLPAKDKKPKYPVPGIPIDTGKFNTKPEDISKLPANEKQFIEDKLNSYLLKILLSLIGFKWETIEPHNQKLNIKFQGNEDMKFGDFICQVVLPELSKVPEAEKALQTISLEGLKNDNRTVRDVLQMDRPLKDNQAFSDEVKKVKIHFIADTAIGNSTVAGKLNERGIDENTPAEELEKLVDEKILTKTQKERLKNVFDYTKITGENLPLVKVLSNESGIKSAKDLAKLESSDWEEILKTINNETPTGEDKQVYIENVMKTIEDSFPTEFTMKRICKIDKDKINDTINVITPLLKNNPDILNVKVMDWKGIPKNKQNNIKKGLETLRSFVNKYRHLGFDEILNSDKSVDDKTAAMQRTVDGLKKFYDNNPQLDIIGSDFISNKGSKEGGFNWSGVPVSLQPKIQRQMLSIQRTRDLTQDFGTSAKLMEKGLDSAYTITNMSRERFISESGVAEDIASDIYANAQRRSASVSHQMGAIMELNQNQHLRLNVDNTIIHRRTGFGFGNGQNSGNGITLIEQLRNELKDIDGFEDLFGPQNFCQCDNCKSIFSPAAYFVDLMYFIEENITMFSRTPGKVASYPKNGNSNYILWLQNRRPDLWNIELTCECTYKMLPYLQIVNEVLETYIKRVNDWTDVYKELAETTYSISFHSPKYLSLNELFIWLEHFDIKFHEIVKALKGWSSEYWMSYLKMHPEELLECNTPFKKFGGKSAFTSISVTEFLKHTKISRNELDLLLNTKYISNNSHIKIEKETFDEGIQYFNEIMKDIDSKALSYIYYFVRLWEKLPWTIQEFDLILDIINRKLSLSNASSPYNLNQIESIIRLSLLQDNLKVSVEELVGLVDIIPNISIKSKEKTDPLTQELFIEKEPGYYERKFNLEKIFGTDSTIIMDLSVDNEPFAYFLSGLNIKKDDFNILKEYLNPGVTTLTLEKNTPSVLSTYFKHIKLAKSLKLSFPEYLDIINLVQQDLQSFEGILDFVDKVNEIKQMPFSLKDLFILTKPNEINWGVSLEEMQNILHLKEFPYFTKDILKAINTSDFSETEVEQIFEQMESNRLILYNAENDSYNIQTNFNWETLEDVFSTSLWTTYSSQIKEAFSPFHYLKSIGKQYFAKADLAAISEITLNDVDTLISALETANPAIIISTPDRGFFRILDNYNIQYLSEILEELPEETLSEQTTKQLLISNITSLDIFFKNHTPRVQYKQIWKELTGVSEEIIDSLISYVSDDWAASFTEMISNIGSDGIPTGFNELCMHIKKLGLLFSNLKFTSSSIDFLKVNSDTVFDLTNITPENLFTLESINKLIEYKGWVELDSAVINEILHPMLLEIHSSDRIKTISAFKHYFEISESLTNSIPVPGDLKNLQASSLIKDKILICQRLGISGLQLNNFISSAYEDIYQLTNIIKANYESGFESEEQLLKDSEPYIKTINELKRDILTEYLLAREVDLKFKDMNELYEFFLLDPQMSGCMKISRMVAAHLSCQLYVHRVQMNLEQSQQSDFKAILNPDVLTEWSWMKNYQVWVANRKVGVYAENYIEPEWRDDKSPEFKQLEEELLQEKISLESAESAYKEYFKKIAELGKLIIAGVYNDSQGNGKATYHIFGRTATDPYVYCYRRFSPDINLWTPWEKLNVQIASPNISAIKYLGKLYIFWADVVSKEYNILNNGNLGFFGFNNEVYVNYSYLGENRRWLQPQKLGPIINGNLNGPGWIQWMLLDGRDVNQPENSYFWKNNTHDFYLNSKTYRKIYPYIENGRLCLQYVREGRIWTDGFNDTYAPFFLALDFYNNKLVDSFHDVNNSYYNKVFKFGPYKHELRLENAGVNQSRGYGILDLLEKQADPTQSLPTVCSKLYSYKNCNLSIVNDHYERNPNHTVEYFLSLDRDSFLLSKDISYNYRRKMHRLNSSIMDNLGNILFENRLEDFLDVNSSQKLCEKSIDIITNLSYLTLPNSPTDHLDFKGSFGNYYRELFFHIPFLIADHLNAEGKYKDADWWYKRIFDPTAAEENNLSNPVDRNWRYMEFRNQDFPKYSVDLTDPAFLEVYKNDPFNPHAIARLRPSTYPKSIVLKYVANLLDWADSLFRKFQFESINEAMMLYILVQDILGTRPQEVGKCKTAADEKLTYAQIYGNLQNGSDFLIWMENKSINMNYMDQFRNNIGMYSGSLGLPGKVSSGNVLNYASRSKFNSSVTNANSVSEFDGNVSNEGTIDPRSKFDGSDFKSIPNKNLGLKFSNSYEPAFNIITRQTKITYGSKPSSKKLLFCVPMNKEILELWDRVENRLYNIRHCLNINGEKQMLSLFAPVIDPRMLVAARAAGMSIEDALASLNAPIPNYRFNYMLEKAKSFVGTVQSFGGALLSALEKKDGEELTLLRSVHEQNILKLMTEIKKQQIEENKANIKNLEETKKNVEIRKDYYSGLINEGLLNWEIAQQVATHTVSTISGIESVIQILRGTLGLIPNIGAPTAITFGGVQLEKVAAGYGHSLQALSRASSALASSAGLEAGNQRRKQEWEQQKKVADQELKAIDQQIAAAQIRLLISEKDLQIHEKQIEQAKELYDFYKNKFTNIGLYKYMATTLSRLFSQSYNMAFDMAKKAEKCYEFETDNNTKFFIQNDNWDSGYAGFLAGERLLLQLQHMERSYIENTPRKNEIRQSFSLRMLAPESLVALQKTGECSFTIPEWIFDVYYPGYYKRVIKSVYMTMPCITGPYTNVPARLSLLSSQIRTKAKDGVDNIFSGPGFANTSITASSANNDGGQFELNFQDIRYLPFEGAGAVESNWSLLLPTTIKTFDYETISDVIITLNYTAEFDPQYKEIVETNITNIIEGNSFYKLLNLKQEFPEFFHRLINGDLNKILDIQENIFPYYFKGKTKKIEAVQYFTFDNDEPWENIAGEFTNNPWSIDLEGTPLTENNIILLIKYKVQ